MGTVDREAVVRRHTVEVTALDPTSPLSVGNGELCMTVDVTGLQTFPAQYPVTDPAGGAAGTLLGTQAQWGWHSVPPPGGVEPALRHQAYRTSRGEVPYVDAPRMAGSDESALDEADRWLRANPHRLDLVRIGLVTCAGRGRGGEEDDGRGGADARGRGPQEYRPPLPSELEPGSQVLDLWTGVIESRTTVGGEGLEVTTACHPDRDVLAVRVTRLGPRPAEGWTTAVRLAFPYGSTSWSNAADWSRPEAHRTVVVPEGPNTWTVERHLDDEHLLDVHLGLGEGVVLHRAGAHELLVSGDAAVLELVVGLTSVPAQSAPAQSAQVQSAQVQSAQARSAQARSAEPAPWSVSQVVDASRAHWPAFWRSGAAVDLGDCTDPRAPELERRVVLSQYLTAIQCAGSTPPQETGLTCNSWRGRSHLEMHWWHAAHFALWGRPALLERSMDWYRRVLPRAQQTALVQGCRGARWPKQVGPDGRESPSDIGPFLLWQQPHVVHLAELLRRASPEDDVVGRYAELVEQTAWFMADVVEPREGGGFGLGPPLVPAQESYAALRARVVDPPFELAAWAWALQVAQEWRERAGLPREPRWDEVALGMVRPLVRDGRYEAIGVEPFTIRTDHPSMVYGLGVIPPTHVLDPTVVRATLEHVLEDWDWASTWGWDHPALAMTAARLDEPEIAVEVLLRDAPKNVHLPNGHNRQTDHLPVYLPGNGGLLAAVALLVGGWDGAGRAQPGLPDDGRWAARHEGFVTSP